MMKEEEEVFKKPSMPVSIKSNLADAHDVKNDSLKEEQGSQRASHGENATSLSSFTASKIGTAVAPIPYTQPSWGGLPDTFYALEELKSGVSLKMIPLDGRSFYCFGRHENCHIVMAHPTVSRYHAVIQFRATFSPTDEKKGFYIFDMGSTHGTYVNKTRIQPKTYVKLQVGHMIKFGSSSRLFLLHGPDSDQEKESQYSYTQLREMRQKELEEREKAYLEERAKLLEEEDKGIDWGMGEDAVEEPDLTENPFAVTTNEELYIDDPKKVLRNWFEREGEELEYNVEEKGFGQFCCKIELPMESGTMTAEATVSGKKKEAVCQCALEACRILDRCGLLHQSTRESKQKRRKNWAEDDYYDSDEDNFFDRTGELENKRKQRMIQDTGQQHVVDTYDTLMEKHKKVLKEVREIEEKLHHMEAVLHMRKQKNLDDEDNLDSFMSSLNTLQPVDKIEQRKCKTRLSQLKSEEERLRKLINFTKPYNLPELKLVTEDIELQPEIGVNEISTTCGRAKSPKSLQNIENPTEGESSAKEIPTLQKHEITTGAEDIEQTHTEVDDSSKRLEEHAMKQKMKSKKKPKTNPSFNSGIEDFNNLVWIPPKDQTGDGRTSLNDKLGY